MKILNAEEIEEIEKRAEETTEIGWHMRRANVSALTATVKHYMELLRSANKHLYRCMAEYMAEERGKFDEPCDCGLTERRAAVAEYDRKR